MKKAFTLIELLLVTAIIGILATAALTSLGKAREKARDVQRVANSKQMILALELYYDDYGGYPCDTTANNDDWDVLVSELEKVEIMRAAPVDKANPYHYYSSATTTNMAQDYVLGIELENEGHAGLKNDVDGVIYGLDCADPIYCLKL